MGVHLAHYAAKDGSCTSIRSQDIAFLISAVSSVLLIKSRDGVYHHGADCMKDTRAGAKDSEATKSAKVS